MTESTESNLRPPNTLSVAVRGMNEVVTHVAGVVLLDRMHALVGGLLE